MKAPPAFARTGFPIATVFLTDKGQRAEGIANLIGEFLSRARRSLEIAMYDLRLDGTPADVLAHAVRQAVGRGVHCRLVFNEEHSLQIPVPPPPQVDWSLVKRMGIHFHPINGIPDLMHHKYVVRDAGTPEAEVLTGSTNWTNDAWTRQENILVKVTGQQLADAYLQNFEELWTTGKVADSGRTDPDWMELPTEGAPIRVRAHFAPGHGEQLAKDIGNRIMAARRRVLICSPVITSAPVLAGLLEAIKRPGMELAGAYDATEMAEVLAQWHRQDQSSWKIAAFHAIRAVIPFGAKASIPFEVGSVHNFMHAKTVVADDTVFAGSFNLSHTGEKNAENMLEIENAPVAEHIAEYIRSVAATYRSAAVGALTSG